MDKHIIYIHGGEEARKALSEISKYMSINGPKSNWTRPDCVFGYSVGHDGSIGWTDTTDWFKKHGYQEVTPKEFLKAWFPDIK